VIEVLGEKASKWTIDDFDGIDSILSIDNIKNNQNILAIKEA
jgi:hypothetical protein